MPDTNTIVSSRLPRGLDPESQRAVTCSGVVAALAAVRALEQGEEPGWHRLTEQTAEEMMPQLSPLNPTEREAESLRSAELAAAFVLSVEEPATLIR